MTHWTEEQLAEYRASLLERLSPPSEDASEMPDEGPESALQSKIVAWCKGMAYPFLSFRQSRHAKGFLAPGWPDITICLPSGRVLFIELKSAKGIIKSEQRAIHLQLMALGHEIHVIRSFKAFLEVVDGRRKNLCSV